MSNIDKNGKLFKKQTKKIYREAKYKLKEYVKESGMTYAYGQLIKIVDENLKKNLVNSRFLAASIATFENDCNYVEMSNFLVYLTATQLQEFILSNVQTVRGIFGSRLPQLINLLAGLSCWYKSSVMRTNQFALPIVKEYIRSLPDLIRNEVFDGTYYNLRIDVDRW